MRNNSNKNKCFTSSEKEQINRLYNELTTIKDRVARYSIACEVAKDMREFDIGV